jgi:hypothetical protein
MQQTHEKLNPQVARKDDNMNKNIHCVAQLFKLLSVNSHSMQGLLYPPGGSAAIPHLIWTPPPGRPEGMPCHRHLQLGSRDYVGKISHGRENLNLREWTVP